MQTACQMEPKDRKGYITDLGQTLVKEYGKKAYYKPEEVKKAHKQSAWSYADFSCWGMSVFSSHEDFDVHHQETGEACDYAAMKAEMLQGLSTPAAESWLDVPDLDMDASWLDFEGMLDAVLEGGGELLAGLLDGL